MYSELLLDLDEYDYVFIYLGIDGSIVYCEDECEYDMDDNYVLVDYGYVKDLIEVDELYY